MEPDLDLDLAALRMLTAIGERGSITAAAAALGYSQPAVSQQLKRVEAKLGIPVVERVGRRARLTEAGRVLARHASSVESAMAAAADELAELRGLRSGRVRLVGFPSASPTIVPRLLGELLDARPGVAVTYVEAEPPEAVEAVRAGRADIALTFSYPGDRDDPHGESARGLDVSAVGADDLLLVLPEGHPAADAADPMAELADEDWIAGCPRCRGHLLELCDRAGLSPRIAFETDNIAAVESLVAQRIGVATLPRLAVDAFPLRPGVVTRALPPEEQRTLHVVTARGAGRVPAVGWTLAAIGRAVAAHAGGPAAA